MKIKNVFLVPVICLIVLATIVMPSCQFIKNNDIKNILSAYTAEDSIYKYYSFKADVRECRYLNAPRYENECYFSLEVDYDYFKEKHGDNDFLTLDGEKRWENVYSSFNKYEFQFIPSNYKLLKENGGYDLLEEGVEVIITANDYYGWAGWEYPILSLEINGTTFLEFETGKDNYLNYVRAGFKDT